MRAFLLAAIVATVALLVIILGLLWYLDRESERSHEERRTTREMEHEERKELFEDEDL